MSERVELRVKEIATGRWATARTYTDRWRPCFDSATVEYGLDWTSTAEPAQELVADSRGTLKLVLVRVVKRPRRVVMGKVSVLYGENCHTNRVILDEPLPDQTRVEVRISRKVKP